MGMRMEVATDWVLIKKWMINEGKKGRGRKGEGRHETSCLIGRRGERIRGRTP